MNTHSENAAPANAAFFNLIRNPAKFKIFLLQKLPAAFFSGLKLITADNQHCAVCVPYKWFTQNPFRSTYFACLSMAAEMSTGVLAMAHIYKIKPGVSMLVVGNESRFLKKATGKTIFTCSDGEAIKAAVEKSIATGEGQTIIAKSIGYNKKEEIVAEFLFTWSFKPKG